MLKKNIIIIWLIGLLQTASIAERVNLTGLNKTDWIYLETENFNIITDTGEENARKIVRELENFRFFLGIVLNYKQKPLSQKVSVVAIKNDSTFNSTGIPDNFSGLFLKTYRYAIFAMCDDFRYSSKWNRIPGRCVLFHELAHFFIENSSLKLDFPPWYDEGIAEYFSTYLEKDGKVFFGDMGGGKLQHFAKLKRNRGRGMIDTEFLFKTTLSDLNIYNKSIINKNNLERFYTLAFLVVKYMLQDADHKRQMNQYLTLVRQGASIDESFKHVFNMSFRDLDRKIRNYLFGKAFNRNTFSPEKIYIDFPEVKIKKHDITRRVAMELLYSNIAILPEKLLGKGNREKLDIDMEKLYPGLVNDIFEKRKDIMDRARTN